MKNEIAEQKALESILKKLTKAYEAMTNNVNGYNSEYNDLKQYMMDYRYEMDKMEMFANQRALQTIDSTGVMLLKQQMQLKTLLDSPYFGRIDFVYEGDDPIDAEIFYIGKFSFTDEDGEVCIYDWRAPIASMYYDFEIGAASYEALNGAVHGELIAKRQLKISEGQLQYVLNSSLSIHDEILQKELSQTSDNRMKTIINTIQKEQNAIVRNDQAQTIVIQGVAGSGKTSIALHRIAYLLYRHKDTLSSNRVMIISPNKVFADYISTVLPELGEEPIRESSFGEIAEKILPAKYTFTTLYEQTKQCIEKPDGKLAERVAFKSSLAFFEELTQFLLEQNASLLKDQNMTVQEIEISGEYLMSRFMSYQKEPVVKRLEFIADDILAILKAKRQGEIKLPSRTELMKRLKKRLRYDNPLALYKAFYEEKEAGELFVMKNNCFEFADVYPYLYCYTYFEGIDTFDLIQHLVIDEMQDYTPLQFAVIQQIFSCKKTILGDFSQSLNPFAINGVNSFTTIFPQMDFVELKKSYRSSYEIIEFTKQFLPEGSIEAVERHGEQPCVLQYKTLQEQQKIMKEQLTKFQQSLLKTCGIICKTAAQVEQLRSTVEEMNGHVLDEQSTKFHQGITLTTVQLAKGLEFDTVIIPFVDGDTYESEFDKGLLYVACTRALHHLVVLKNTKDPTPFSV